MTDPVIIGDATNKQDMNGDMGQRGLNKFLDMVCRTARESGERMVVDLDTLQHLYRPMPLLAEGMVRFAVTLAGLRSADDYFTLDGHLRMAARRNSCVFFRPYAIDPARQVVVIAPDAMTGGPLLASAKDKA